MKETHLAFLTLQASTIPGTWLVIKLLECSWILPTWNKWEFTLMLFHGLHRRSWKKSLVCPADTPISPWYILFSTSSQHKDQSRPLSFSCLLHPSSASFHFRTKVENLKWQSKYIKSSMALNSSPFSIFCFYHIQQTFFFFLDPKLPYHLL